MTEKSFYVRWFRDCRSDSASEVGAKNAEIGEMSHAGIPVPDGFAVTTRAHEDFLDTPGLRERIDESLSEFHVHGVAAAERTGSQIRRLIASIPLSEELEGAIRSAYHLLSQEQGVPDIPVAVRSSATAEDLPEASFAGQHETFLWVRGTDQVIDKFKACVSSLFTPRALCYRSKMGLADWGLSMSVGVQKMVNARVAGVLFTLNPANGDLSKVVVEANWGLGVSVVGGEVTPDSYIVDKVAFEIVRRVISPKTVQYVVESSTGDVVSRIVPLDRQKTPCLTDEEVLGLARMGKAIEEHYGRPQNVEWAIDTNLPSSRNLLILQSRPETAWRHKERYRPTHRRDSILDHMLHTLEKGRSLRQSR